MRIDKWLSSVNVVKRRTVALDMIKSGVVSINGMKVKPSREVKVGDKVKIEYLKGAREFEVLKDTNYKDGSQEVKKD